TASATNWSSTPPTPTAPPPTPTPSPHTPPSYSPPAPSAYTAPTPNPQPHPGRVARSTPACGAIRPGVWRAWGPAWRMWSWRVARFTGRVARFDPACGAYGPGVWRDPAARSRPSLLQHAVLPAITSTGST